MFVLEEFIANCRAALTEHSPQAAIKEIVAQAMARPGEVERALGTPTWAELVPLHRSDDLTILNVIWAPGMSLYPHDHRMWAVIGIYGGREENGFYRRTPRGLVKAGGRQLDVTDTLGLGKSVIHAVTNPLSQFTGAIHVYGGDFFAVPRSEFDPVTFEESPFDIERAKQRFLEANERVGAQRSGDR
jgi:predicted metal-dependent enzyme (double-stranded beta helix superfamily)